MDLSNGTLMPVEELIDTFFGPSDGSAGLQSDYLQAGGVPVAEDHVCQDTHGAALSASAPLIDQGSSSTQVDKLCWGAQLTGSSANCTAGFTVGHAHFKNKFCAACRQKIELPVARLRALTPELGAAFSLTYKTTAGFWKEAPPACGGGLMRIVNHTMTCQGPWVIICKDTPAPLAWAELPQEWVGDGCITFRVAKGTLVPHQALDKAALRSRKRSRASESCEEAESTRGTVGALAMALQRPTVQITTVVADV